MFDYFSEFCSTFDLAFDTLHIEKSSNTAKKNCENEEKSSNYSITFGTKNVHIWKNKINEKLHD